MLKAAFITKVYEKEVILVTDCISKTNFPPFNTYVGVTREHVPQEAK